MTASPSRTVAPVSAICAAFAAQPSTLPARSPKTGRCAGVRECCKYEKGDQNVYRILLRRISDRAKRQVQTLKDLLEACPEDSFHFMTPFGYVDLNAQDAEQLQQGAAMPAHAGESGWEIPIPAEKIAAAGACDCAENREWSVVRDHHRSAAGDGGIGAGTGDATVTGSAFRAVTPVSAVCAVFQTQPSAYPQRATKPDVAPTCGSVAKAASAEKEHLWANFGRGRSRKRRSRTKPRCRADPAAVTSARGAGSLGIPRRGC